MSRRIAGRLATLVASGAVLAAAACTSSTGPSPSPPPSSSSSSSSSVSAASTPVIPTSSPPVTPSTSAVVPTSTSAAPTPPHTSIPVAQPPGPPPCTAAQLSTRAQAAGAAAGEEIAFITFTNTSSKICTLSGYPRASLRLKGTPLGQPAQPKAGEKIATVTLGAGHKSQAMLYDRTDCQAAESDTVRIQPPGIATAVDTALEERGCFLTIYPVTTPTS